MRLATSMGLQSHSVTKTCLLKHECICVLLIFQVHLTVPNPIDSSSKTAEGLRKASEKKEKEPRLLEMNIKHKIGMLT